MILRYVLKNFRRRKVRTVLMVISLIISTGLIVTMSAAVETLRRSIVDIASGETGRYDLLVERVDTYPDPFIQVSDTRVDLLAADPLVTAVYPRFESEVELQIGDKRQNGTLLAIESDESIGRVDVVTGTYQLGNMNAALLHNSSLNLGNPQLGDVIEVTYSYPQPRQSGSVAAVGSSQRVVIARFTITAIVRQNGITKENIREGLIVDIHDAQIALGLPDQAELLVALVEPALYDVRDTEAAALSVRDVAVNVQNSLGEDYRYRLEKAQTLDQSVQVFLTVQALVTTYGLMSLGVVGLLIYTLVMTNVQEQRREMAILRILGSPRSLLFGAVIVEVFVIGLVGVSIGIVLGQAITVYVLVPFINFQMTQSGLGITTEPAVSVAAVLPAVISAFLVLIISAIKPAQDAAKTKVIHAINPGVADNIQLEDLDQLRERRPDLRLFFIGWGLLLMVLLLGLLGLVELFGNPAILAAMILTILMMMVIGVVFIFFIFTRPLERLILFFTGLIAPRLTYFASRNVGRGTERNTLISLLVLFSGVLPSFLATQSAISNANIETDVRLDMGAPVELNSFAQFSEAEFAHLSRLRPSFVTDEFATLSGIDAAVGLTYDYRAPFSDAVDMRSGSLQLVGVTGDLNDVLFPDLIIFSGGGAATLAEILTDPYAIVISEGMSEGLAVPLGGSIKVQGAGLDHKEVLRVAGIAQRIPGFSGVGRIRNVGMNNGTVFISLAGFQRISTDPREALPGPDEPVLDRVLATTHADADPEQVERLVYERFQEDYDIWIRLAEVELERARTERVQEQVFLLVMTLISFITAVFGVFAVIYVMIYSRRLEMGMMKAIGARNWELNGMLSVESIAMTLSAALAGILAGGTMAYLFTLADNLAVQRPQQFALDTTVMPFIIIMVSFASILGTVLSARRIVKRKAVEILRMS